MTSSLSLVLEHAFFALTTEIKLFHYADSSIRMLYTVQYVAITVRYIACGILFRDRK